jgi:type II secretory pathway predicted ATPase ExeA
MEAYRYFRLRQPPFEARPDPAFYYETPGHAEALATAQYAVHAAKACCVILGESGSGKTLLGRILADHVNRTAPVLWIPSIGQPAGATEVQLYPPGSSAGNSTLYRVCPESTTLAAWVRSATPAAQSSVVIVDNADALPRHGWIDVLSLLTREFRRAHPTTVVLLGLPQLLTRLDQGALVRLRRRIFRTCELRPFTRDEITAYIHHRLTRAGGDIQPFTPAAEDMIFHLSGGNPALVNQICDNALVDAYGDDRTTIDAQHVVTAVRAIIGPLRRRPRLLLERLCPAMRVLVSQTALPRLNAPLPHTSPITATMSGDSHPGAPATADPAADRAAQPLRDEPSTLSTSASEEVSVPDTAAELVEELAVALSGTEAPHAAQPATEARAAATATAVSPRTGDCNAAAIAERLRVVQERVREALARVRAARAREWNRSPARVADGTPALDNDPDPRHSAR